MKDFTKKWDMRLLLSFMMPLIVSELFQEVYALVNTAVISKVRSYEAVAVMGSVSSLTTLRSYLFVDMTAGFGIFLAKCIGSQNPDRLDQAFFSAVKIIFVIYAGCLAAVVFPWPFLAMVKVPENLIPEAVSYLRVMLAGCMLVGLRNLMSCTIQGFGETKILSILSAFSVVTHTGLVILMIAILRTGATSWKNVRARICY